MPRFVTPLAASVFLALMLTGAPAILRAGESQDLGRRLYNEAGCASCHGLNGQGSAVAGPRLVDRTLPLESFARQVRRPANEMPSYSDKVLSDDALRAIYDYVGTIPASPRANDLLLLRPFLAPESKGKP